MMAEETRAKISAANKARWADPEYRAKALIHVQNMRQRWLQMSPEERSKVRRGQVKPHHRAAIAARMKAWFRIPENRLKYIETARKRVQTKQESEARVATIRRLNADPDFQAKRMAATLRAAQARKDRQAAILADYTQRVGMTPACRDVDRLRDAVAHGLFPSTLAVFLGVRFNTLARWLSGQYKPATYVQPKRARQ